MRDVASGAVAPILTEEIHGGDTPGTHIPSGTIGNCDAAEPSAEASCVLLKSIAPSVARAELKKVLSSVEGAPLLRLRVRLFLFFHNITRALRNACL